MNAPTNIYTYMSMHSGAMVFHRCAEKDFQVCRENFLSFCKYARISLMLNTLW